MCCDSTCIVTAWFALLLSIRICSHDVLVARQMFDQNMLSSDALFFNLSAVMLRSNGNTHEPDVR